MTNDQQTELAAPPHSEEQSHETTGYLHPLYAASLSEFGTPRELPASGGWVLERPVSGTPHRDAMGCYPLFACRDWSQLTADIDELRSDLVSLTLVTDPFGDYTEADLQRAFNAVTIPFKQHYVLDLHRPFVETLSKSTRKKGKRAVDMLEVEACKPDSAFLDSWMILYNTLIERHDIRGIRAFSRASFAQQFATPGCVTIQVKHEGVLVGAQVCYLQGDVVQCHLAAFTEAGYQMRAGYAMDWFSVHYFAERARWYNLGGGAGTHNDGTDGLTLYKQSWSSETRMAYLCGVVLNPDVYNTLTAARNPAPTSYFPAYRQGEFN